MKVTIFQANKGDCLLLAGQDGTHMLVDGGLKDSFSAVGTALGDRDIEDNNGHGQIESFFLQDDSSFEINL